MHGVSDLFDCGCMYLCYETVSTSTSRPCCGESLKTMQILVNVCCCVTYFSITEDKPFIVLGSRDSAWFRADASDKMEPAETSLVNLRFNKKGKFC